MKRNYKITIYVFFMLTAYNLFSNKIEQNDLIILNKMISKLDKTVQEEINKDPIIFINNIKKLFEADKDNLLMLINKEIPLDKNYEPNDLVYIKNYNELQNLGRDDLKIREIVIPYLIKMQKDAKKNGLSIKIASAYRTRKYQEFLFDYNVKTYGRKVAEAQSAIPGHSQHQTGTTIDFIKIDDNLLNSKEGKWLENNAWKYGFSLSYPKKYEKNTGYKSEPWHYMYIGVDACIIQKKYFNNLQYKLLEFFNENKKELLKLVSNY